MKIAVLFAGQMRTFSRVADCLRTNLIEPNKAVIFAAIESSEAESAIRQRFEEAFPGAEIGGIVVRESFRDSEFDCIMKMIEGRPATHPSIFERCTIRDNILWDMDFLRRSGSVVQFYQVRWAWDLLLKYESEQKMRFDICVRSRLDNLLTTPLPLQEFFSQTWRNDELWARSLGSSRIESVLRQNLPREGDYSDGMLGVPSSPDEVVWTFAVDWFWVATRSTFSHLANMVYHFGRWDGPVVSPFSAEHFFHQFCKHNGWLQWSFDEGSRIEGDSVIHTMYNHGMEPVKEDPFVFSLLR